MNKKRKHKYLQMKKRSHIHWSLTAEKVQRQFSREPPQDTSANVLRCYLLLTFHWHITLNLVCHVKKCALSTSDALNYWSMPPETNSSSDNSQWAQRLTNYTSNYEKIWSSSKLMWKVIWDIKSQKTQNKWMKRSRQMPSGYSSSRCSKTEQNEQEGLWWGSTSGASCYMNNRFHRGSARWATLRFFSWESCFSFMLMAYSANTPKWIGIKIKVLPLCLCLCVPEPSW